MKILIDISQIVYETGVSVYTKNLVKNLLKIDKSNKYILFGTSLRMQSSFQSFIHDLEGNFETRFYPIPPTVSEWFWNKGHGFTIERLVGKVDVFHSSDWVQPPSEGFKVTTVHDLAPILFPNLTPSQIVDVHKRRLRLVKRHVDRIIVPSNATKKDLGEFGVDKKKIRVIYEATEKHFKKVGKDVVESVKSKYNLKGKYLLSVGVGDRKNTQRIIEAFERVNLEEFQMVFIGKNTVFEAKNDKTVFLGHVSDKDKLGLYSGAEALVYPSIYEGFGIPLLEAFACECPVLTSNTSSLSEIAGNSAVLVNPMSVESIKQGIGDILQDREKWIKRGLKQAEKFNWEKTARETLKVYEEGEKYANRY